MPSMRGAFLSALLLVQLATVALVEGAVVAVHYILQKEKNIK